MKLLALDDSSHPESLAALFAGRAGDIDVIAAGPGPDAGRSDYRQLAFERLPNCPSLPSLAALASLLAEVQPDACLVRGDPAFVRLVRVLVDSMGLPVFQFLENEAQLGQVVRVTKARPDLFLVTNETLLPAVLTDDRYGSTILPLGDVFAPQGADPAAGDRLVGFLGDWTSGRLPSARPALSIVVPAYREAANLPVVCERLIKMIRASALEAEVILVDDASPDDTYRVALASMLLSPRIRAFTKTVPRGIGNAIRHGVDRARADIITITMGDGSDDVDCIPEMVRTIADNGHGLAIGCRYRRRENYAAIPRLYRFWSWVFRIVTRVVIGVRLSDYTNAFRTFRRSALSRYWLESGGFEISPEITFKMWFATGRVAEVDVRHLKRASGQSKFSFLRAGPGYGKILLKAFINRLTGRWFVLDW